MNKHKVMWIVIGLVILAVLIIAKIAIIGTVLVAKVIAKEGWHAGSFCEFADNFDDQDACYFKMAVKFEKPSYCENISANETKTLCSQTLAYLNK